MPFGKNRKVQLLRCLARGLTIRSQRKPETKRNITVLQMATFRYNMKHTMECARSVSSARVAANPISYLLVDCQSSVQKGVTTTRNSGSKESSLPSFDPPQLATKA